MPDLFINPDEQFLLARWDHLTAIFRIVIRDYHRVLTGEETPDRHRTIIIQTVSDLIDLEADLFRLGKDSPSDLFDSRVQAAVGWVGELRGWRFPHPNMTVEEIEESLVRRKLAEERFNAALQCDGDPECSPTLVVQSF
jgi:hypothetical protein